MSNTNLSKTIFERIQNLENNIERLETLLVNINNKLDKNHSICKKMDNHISFIETTYSVMRQPLNFLCNKLNYLINNETDKELLLKKGE